jgi:hypothetical protein
MKKRSAKPRMKPKVPEVVCMKATPHGVTLIALSGNTAQQKK